MNLFRRKPRFRLERKEALAARPIRNPEVGYERQEEGEVLITLRRRKDWLTRVLSLAFVIPTERKIQLDQVGSQVWELCDGEHTVEDLIREMAGEHKLQRREAEVSLTTYLRLLGKRRLIGILVQKEKANGDS